MYKLIEKIKELNSMIEDNKEVVVSAQEDKNNATKQSLNCATTMEKIEQFAYGRCFKILTSSKNSGKICLLTKFADEDFYVKDIETGELYMSVSEELERNTKKVTILKCSKDSSEFYLYLNRNGQNDLIRAAIMDNENNKKLVVTNTDSHKLTENELVEYATEIQLGGMLDNILAQNMDAIKNMINANDGEEEIKRDANDSFERYQFREDEFYSEVKNDEDMSADIQEYLRKYKVTLNGQNLDEESATLEIGNAMEAIDEEEVQRPRMYNYCFDLNSLIKLQIARTQGIQIQKNNLSDAREY